MRISNGFEGLEFSTSTSEFWVTSGFGTYSREDLDLNLVPVHSLFGSKHRLNRAYLGPYVPTVLWVILTNYGVAATKPKANRVLGRVWGFADSSARIVAVTWNSERT